MMKSPTSVWGAPRQSEIMQMTALHELPASSLLTMNEVAKILRISRASVRRLVERRAIRFHKICSRICFKKAELDSFIEEHATEAGPSSTRYENS
jgi:excisionase family DNA binding protein